VLFFFPFFQANETNQPFALPFRLPTMTTTHHSSHLDLGQPITAGGHSMNRPLSCAIPSHREATGLFAIHPPSWLGPSGSRTVLAYLAIYRQGGRYCAFPATPHFFRRSPLSRPS